MRKLIRRFLRLPKKYILLAVVILAILGWFFFIRGSNNETVQPKTEQEEVLENTVSASGVLKGKDTVSLKFASGGRLSYVGAKEGENVKKGQVVARLDTQELSVALQQAKNTLRDKEATLQKVYDDVKDHKADESFAQKQERTTAEVAKDNAYDQVRAIEASLRNSFIYSPIAGVVTQSPFLAGQFISGADLVVQVADDMQIYFDAEIDEADITRVQVGAGAEVTLNSLPEKVLLGTVEKIVPQTKTSSSGATVVIVRIVLENTETHFVSGINGQVEIKVN